MTVRVWRIENIYLRRKKATNIVCKRSSHETQLKWILKNYEKQYNLYSKMLE